VLSLKGVTSLPDSELGRAEALQRKLGIAVLRREEM